MAISMPNTRYSHTPRMPSRRASRIIQTKIARPRKHRSTVIERLAGFASVSCQNATFAPTKPRDRYATLWAQVPASASRSEEHTSELQSLMRNSYAVFCLKKKKHNKHFNDH